LALAWAGGCGQVEFIPSPYTAQGLQARYSPDEDLTVLRWWFEATGDDVDGVSFDILQADGTWKPVRFEAAPYASGIYKCDLVTCAQFAVRGRYPLSIGSASPIRSHSPDGFVVPGLTVRNTAVQIKPSLAVSAAFASDNLSVHVAIADPLFDGSPLARKYAMAVWPQGSGDCTQPLSDDVDVTSATADPSIQQPLAPEGRYCVSVHGRPDDGGHFVRFGAAALSLPETVSGMTPYAPPAEQAPVLLQLVLDLAIADPARCQQVETTLLQTLRGACATAATGGSFHEFSLIDLAPNCVRSDSRSFDAVATADAIKQYVRQNVTQFHNRVVLFYANNLSAQVPSQLEAQLEQLPMAFAGDTRVETFYWSMVAPGATANVTYDLPAVWTAIEDPTFVMGIQQAAMANMPFMTELHDDNVMIQLIDVPTQQHYQGGFIKICTATPMVQLAEGGQAVTTNDVSIDPAMPPGFFVQFAPEITVPRSMYRQDDAIVRWEICSNWCDHPFTNDVGSVSGTSWRSSTECVHTH
jgi:hypothetical protein